MANPSDNDYVVSGKKTVRIGNPNWECIYCRCTAGRDTNNNPICGEKSSYCIVGERSETPADLRLRDYIGKPPPPPKLTQKKWILRNSVNIEGSLDKITRMGSLVDWKSPVARSRSAPLIRSLRWIMEKELRLTAGDLGSAMVNRFFSSGGRTWVHESGSPLSLGVGMTKAYNEARIVAEAHIAKAVQKYRQAHPANRAPRDALEIDVGDLKWIEWSPEAVVWDPVCGPLVAVLGGTKGNKFFVRNLAFDAAGEKYACDLRIEICDHFGVDETDMYTNGLCAFWALQHATIGTQSPFVNVVRVDRRIEG